MTAELPPAGLARPADEPLELEQAKADALKALEAAKLRAQLEAEQRLEAVRAQLDEELEPVNAHHRAGAHLRRRAGEQTTLCGRDVALDDRSGAVLRPHHSERLCARCRQAVRELEAELLIPPVPSPDA